MTPEEIQAKIDDAVKGLKDKNTELLKEISGYKETVSKVKGIDIDALISASNELETLKKKGNEEKGEYKKLYEDLQKAHDEKVKDLEGKLSTVSSEFSGHKKKNAIVSGLTKIGTDPIVLDVAVKGIFDRSAIDDKGVVTIEGKSVDDFMKHWSSSDVGKRFTISGNSGGGANGGSGEGSAGGVERFFDRKSKEYNLTEQAKLAKTNIAEYNRLRKIYG